MARNRFSRVMTTMAIFLGAISFWAFGTLGATEASAAWKPARPEAGHERVRLVPEATAAMADQPSKSSYVFLPTGETAVFLVNGQGKMRIRTRPVFGSAAGPAFFRLGVCFNDTTCRKFKRRSKPEVNFAFFPVGRAVLAGPSSRLLGQENVLDLVVPAGTESIRIQNRDKNGNGICFRVLLQGDLIQAKTVTKPRPRKISKAARSSELIFQVDPAQLGYDSNAYMAPADNDSNQGELFWPVQAEVGFKDRSGRTIEWGAKYVFKGRIYMESLLNEYRHRLKASQKWEAPRNTWAEGLTLGLSEGLAFKKSTFFGRGDEVEFETITLDGTTLSLADRFNSIALNIEPSAHWEISKDVSAAGSFNWLMRDYLKDYGSYVDIYSLDQDIKEFDFELSWNITKDLRVTGTAKLADKQYDEKFSRDLDGIEVETVAANYVKTSGSLGAKWGRRYGPRLGGEIKFYQNEDQYQAYWDYSGHAMEVDGGWRWKSGHRIELKVRGSQIDHDRSHVKNDPAFPLRSKTVLNIRANGQYRLSPRLELVGRFHYKDYDYNNRTFAYNRTLIQAGALYGF